MYRTAKTVQRLDRGSRIARVIVSGLVALIIAAWVIREYQLTEALQPVVHFWHKLSPGNEGQVYFDQGVKQLDEGMSELNSGMWSLDPAKWMEAESSFSKAIELDEDNAEAYYRRGYAHRQLNDAMKAKLDQTKAILLDPSLAEAYMERGYIYSTEGKNDEALADFSAAIRLKPELLDAVGARGMVYFTLERWEEAAQDFTRIIDAAPASISGNEISFFYELRGIVHLKAGKIDEGIADFNKELDLAPLTKQSLQGYVEDLRYELDKLDPSSENYHKLQRLIDRIMA